MTNHEEVFLTLKITQKKCIARDIWLFEFSALNGEYLPPFEAGSNIAVAVPSRARRCYSICNDPQERNRYVIAVKYERNGRGGSISLVDKTSVGDFIKTSLPKNEFPLNSHAKELILIAGGIGITPILSMARQLKSEGSRKFRLYYLTRDQEGTAFMDELSSDDWKPHIKIHHDFGDPTLSFDFWPLFERPKSQVHIYCCGPSALMNAIKDMTGHWPSGTVHFENFGSQKAEGKENKPFQIHLNRSGTILNVPANMSILDVLRSANVHVSSSCESGTCGACKTGLCSGDVDHRDLVLRDDEKQSQIMICVSRANSETIVLDI